MAVKAFLSFLTSVAGLAFVGGIVLIGINASRGRETRPGVIVAAVGLVAVLILAPLNAGLIVVEPNERGVIFRQIGGGEDTLLEPRSPGLSWILPFVDQLTIYDVSQQSLTMEDEPVEGGPTPGAVRAITRDGQSIEVDVTIVYSIDPTEVNRIHREWRDRYEIGFIIPVARSEVRNAISEFGAEDIYTGGRAELENQIREQIEGAIAEQGFLLTDVRIRNIDFSEQFANAIEEKQIAEQQAQRAVFLVQQAEQEAEQARVQAQGEADAVVIAAEGEAQSIIVRAEAEAEALALINELLAENPTLLQYEYINELGEQIELIIIPSNSPFLFDLEQLLEEQGVETETVPTPTPPPAPTPEPEEESGETTP